MVNVELVLSWSWELSAWRWLRSINQDRWDIYKEYLKELVEAVLWHTHVCLKTELIGDVTEASGWILQCTGSLCSDLAKCSKTDCMTPQCTWTMSQTYCMSNTRAFLRQRNGTLIPTQQSIEANLKANTHKKQLKAAGVNGIKPGRVSRWRKHLVMSVGSRLQAVFDSTGFQWSIKNNPYI